MRQRRFAYCGTAVWNATTTCKTFWATPLWSVCNFVTATKRRLAYIVS